MGKIKFPAEIQLRGTDAMISAHNIADDVFPLSCLMMKPYGKQELTDREAIYNYRCSRARRIAENVFGDHFSVQGATHRDLLWPCWSHPYLRRHCHIAQHLTSSQRSFLHALRNLCCCGKQLLYFTWVWRMREDHIASLVGLNPTQSRNSSNQAKAMSNTLADYF